MYFISITFGCATSTAVLRNGGFSANFKFSFSIEF